MTAMLLLSLVLLCRLHSSQQLSISRSSAATYLETNTWYLTLGPMKLLVDPVLSSPLDFGIPLLYSGSKVKVDGVRFLNEMIAQSIDYVILSQGFDDHAHTPTLKGIRQRLPGMKYIAPPSALPILQSCGIDTSTYVKVVRPGETFILSSSKSGTPCVSITATSGALLGPPWQQRENGYLLQPAAGCRTADTFPSIYYEPHCNYNLEELESLKIRADYVISPVVAQELPYFTLVDGMDSALRLAQAVSAKTVLPMANGELEQSGLLSRLVRCRGDVGSFRAIATRAGVAVADIEPGVPFKLT